MTASAALDAFHAEAPVRRLQYVGVEWHYRAAGDGRQGLLLLPGAVGDGDAYFTLAPLLWSTHRLLAIAYPNASARSPDLSTASAPSSPDTIHLSADIDRHGPPSPAGRREWPGEVLILDGKADAIAGAGARSRLKALYPDARVHTFPGAGHSISAERRQEWAATIAAFLTEPSALA